ncbi:TPA: hypothetical protein NWA01_001371 [Escherichia coli]|nr:hypothetical protein [Escherichia coli]
MAKKIALLGFFTFIVANVALAETTSSWIEVATTDTGTFSVKKGTFKNEKGESSALFMLQTKDNKVEYYKATIKDVDCDSGYGEIRFFNMDGRLSFKGDYVADGNSVGAALGDFMCVVRIVSKSNKS